MIDRATVEKIKETADIVEVVSDYVHLTRRGANFMGLCPFHNERTPSFSVNKSKNFCYCFSCHKGGSPVNFIMEKEGISYHDALLQLAKKYGIKVEEKELTDEERREQTRREGMYLANEWAMQEMQKNLTESQEGRDVGLQYLYSRGVTQEAIKAFRPGYAIDSYTSLSEAARKRGFDLDVLRELGLLGMSQQGRIYDRFKGRVIFPILNSSGKPIAFGGRDLKGGPAKYINSPESELYHKSNELYGIYQARQMMVRENRCYLVEGYLDVIGMWQCGLQNAVASSGTALTDGQIALIHRFTPNVTLIYDGDAAGIKAALRGIDMLLSHGLNVKVLLLPDGDDPDSFARKHTAEDFRDYIEKNQSDIIRFKVKVLTADAGNDPQKRVAVVNSVVESLAHIPDKVSRDVYIKECSTMLRVGEEAIGEAVRQRRVSLTEETKRRQQYEQRQATSSDQMPQMPDAPSPEQPTGENTAAQTGKSQTFFGIETYPLMPLEKKIIEYCVRYGYMDFCEVCDDDDNKVTISVVEYVCDELECDGLKFTVPGFAKIFNILLDMLPAFREAADAKLGAIREESRKMRDDGIGEIASKGLTIREIEKEEKALEERISELERKEYEEFTKTYSSIRLTSHEDDEVRRIATRAVRERHQLSHIYSRERPADREEDKLMDYLPRAITELKNGVLDQQMQAVMREFREICGKGMTERETELQQKLATIMRIRSQIAKDIGERIVCPTKRR